MSKQNLMVLRNLLQLFFLITVFSCTAVKPVVEDTLIIVKELVKDPETALVDVRVPEQFTEGSAANAVNIPLATIENNLDFFRKQKNTVIFCNTGRQANEAMTVLKKNGIKNVHYGKTLKNVKAIQAEK